MQKEINKLLKQVNVEKLRKNHKECIELYNIIGGIYSDISSYEEAIYYHEHALEVSKTLGDILNTAIAHRHIGEAKAAIGCYDEAINHIKKYLDLARKVNNPVEIQRAWTTYGRIYLMQAQDLKDSNPNCYADESIKKITQESEKRFQTALSLAQTVRDQVEPKEFAQMKSGLLTNLGIIKDICGQHASSIQMFNKAIEICKVAKIKEDLYRCQVILSSIYRQHYNVKLSVKTSEEALITAKLIGKKLLICDAYIERGLVKILQRDFKEAKRSFAQAYLEKSPSEEDHLKAIRLTKLAHIINETYEKISSEGQASESRFKLCDKLGDLFVAVKSYRLAIEFYRRAFTDARASMRPKTELAAILYSLAETYADDGQFNNAILCYEKEIGYRDGYDMEQCQSLVKIAKMRQYLCEEHEKIIETYEEALIKADNEPKLMYQVLKEYMKFTKDIPFLSSKHRKLEETLAKIKSRSNINDLMEVDADEEDIGVELDDEIANVDDVITDDEDNDEVLMVGRRRKRPGKKFKSDEVGNTPLHEACINGDLKRVKSLLGQGHEVNPRDNAGWIPLHEACNHGHLDIAELLIENGADVCNRGCNGMTPLHDAATNGHFDIMRLLMSKGANVIALTDSGETVLNCFRDFKKRYQNDLSDRELNEYKHLEIELMNQMDKCGYNLMTEKKQATKPPKAGECLWVSSSRENLKRKSPPNTARFSKRTAPTNPPRIVEDDDEDEDNNDDDEDCIVIDDSQPEPEKAPETSKTPDPTEAPIEIRDSPEPRNDLEPWPDPEPCPDPAPCHDPEPWYEPDYWLAPDPVASGKASETKKQSPGIELPDYVSDELKRHEEHLDLQYTRFPPRCLTMVAHTLAGRDFSTVDLSGCVSLFSNKSAMREMIETMSSWLHTTDLRLRCLGLGRQEFERLTGKLCLPSLESLDLSFNSISFRCKSCLTSQLLRLLSSCPKLRRVDLRKNNLSLASFVWPPVGATNGLTTTESAAKMELLTGDQNDYAVYGGHSCACKGVASSSSSS